MAQKLKSFFSVFKSSLSFALASTLMFLVFPTTVFSHWGGTHLDCALPLYMQALQQRTQARTNPAQYRQNIEVLKNQREELEDQLKDAMDDISKRVGDYYNGSAGPITEQILQYMLEEMDKEEAQEEFCPQPVSTTTIPSGSAPPQTPEPKAPEPKAPEPKAPEPKAPEPKAPEPKAPEPKAPEPKAPEPKAPEPKAPEPKAPEPKAPEPKAPEPKAPEPKAPEPKAPEPKAPEPKAPEPKAPEPKAPEPKAPADDNKVVPEVTCAARCGQNRICKRVGGRIQCGICKEGYWEDGNRQCVRLDNDQFLLDNLENKENPKVIKKDILFYAASLVEKMGFSFSLLNPIPPAYASATCNSTTACPAGQQCYKNEKCATSCDFWKIWSKCAKNRNGRVDADDICTNIGQCVDPAGLTTTLRLTISGSKRKCEDSFRNMSYYIRIIRNIDRQIEELDERYYSSILNSHTEADHCIDCDIERIRKIREAINPPPSGWQVLGNILGTVGSAALGYYGIREANKLRDRQGFAAQPGYALGLAYPFIMKGLYGGGLLGGSKSMLCSPTMGGFGSTMFGNPFLMQQMMQMQQASSMQQMFLMQQFYSSMPMMGGMMPMMGGGMMPMMGGMMMPMMGGGMMPMMGGMMMPMMGGGMMPMMGGGMMPMMGGGMMPMMGGGMMPMMGGGMMPMMGGMMMSMMGGGMMPMMGGGMMPMMGGGMMPMMGGGMMPMMGGMMPMMGGMMMAGGGMQAYLAYQQSMLAYQQAQIASFMQKQQAVGSLYSEISRLQMQIQAIMYGGGSYYPGTTGGGGQTTGGGGQTTSGQTSGQTTGGNTDYDPNAPVYR